MKMPAIPEIPNEEELESCKVHWLKDGGRIAILELDYNLFLEHFKPLHAIATRQQKAIEILSDGMKRRSFCNCDTETTIRKKCMLCEVRDKAQKILDGEDVG